MIRALLLSLILLAGICGIAAALEEDSLGEFFTTHIAEDLRDPDINGAVITIVDDGEIVALLGYGTADADGSYLLDPEDTILPIGSVTKLFTWEAALSLAEQGLLDFDSDLNSFLPEPVIPDTYTEPITLTHLMTHTSGLDEVAVGIFTQNPEEILPAFETYTKTQPERIREPGRIASYSNIGALLTGAVIEEVSGTSYKEYIEQEILTPLGMASTAAREPLPDHLASRSPEMILTEGIPAYSRYSPAGGMHTTAHDMGLYMIHVLEAGEDAYPRIFSHDNRLSGIVQGGYFERYHGKKRILWHTGDVPGTSTLLALIPEENLGIYICYTGTGGSAERFILLHTFLDTYLQTEREEQFTYQTESTKDYAGTYISSRAPLAGFEKILLVIGRDQLSIWVRLEGEMIVINDAEYAEVEPGFCIGLNNPDRLVFSEREGEDWLFLDSLPSIGWKRAGWRENPQIQYAFLLFFAGVFLSGAVIGGKRAFETTNSFQKKGYLLITLVSGTAILFMLLFFGTIRIFGILFGLPHWFIVIRCIPALTAILAAYLILHTIQNKQKRKIEEVFIGAIAILFLLWLNSWNLLLPV
ncbi:beta-lactamase family protein [Methanocalculus taiwanensis]|uniref:Beta-lactamase family protein n=1 Tax=Methanocalculus taiwanensis TaxID=106207 RepID=A0ABD4THY7_9EURY|nr:serine hydrolase domain-containing protein [Methanocalculus taiwanensis]MCQ1538558.1 beta-lactamase family protein [Methanocalculus taiwanensis]